MVTRELIIKNLKERGYKAEPTDITKNGALLKAIIMGEGKIRPTIYVDTYEAYTERFLDKIVTEIIAVYEQSKEEFTAANIPDNLCDWDFIKTRLQLCIQKQSEEDIVKRKFLDMEQYIRVALDEEHSFKIKESFLKNIGVDEDTLFVTAWELTKPTLVTIDMMEIMSQLMKLDAADLQELQEVAPEISQEIIITNQTKMFGAVAICDKELLAKIAEKYEADLIILPSSIHECIVIPVLESILGDKVNGNVLKEFSTMVSEVNATEVPQDIQLTNHSYMYIRETQEIIY